MRVNTDNILKRSRGWCFTINNFSEEEHHLVEYTITNAKYGIAETEHMGQGEGTPHIQGYVYFENPRKRSELERMLGGRAWLAPAKGSPKQNYDYCSKENSVFVMKPIPKCSERPSFLEMYNDMCTMTIEEFTQKYPGEWYRNREKVMKVMIDNAMKNVKNFDGNLIEKNLWLYGHPGVGKSKWAASQGTYDEIFKKNFNKWWDGYNLLTTKIVILEDYPCAPQGQLLAQHMKIWGDRYPFTAECKGSHLMVEPRRFFFIVTSNYTIDQCFENEEDRAAIKRRFQERLMLPEDLVTYENLDRRIIN